MYIFKNNIFFQKKIGVLRLEARSLINILFELQINIFTLAKIMIILKNHSEIERMKGKGVEMILNLGTNKNLHWVYIQIYP